MKTIIMTLMGQEKDIEVEVSFNYSKGTHGARGCYGEQLEPDDPDEVEVLSAVNLETKEDIYEQLSDKDKAVIDEVCWDSVYADYGGE